MKSDLWLVFVVGAILSWGGYVPVLHEGQALLNKGSIRAFLCVGIAYFLTAVLVPIGLLAAKIEPLLKDAESQRRNWLCTSAMNAVFGRYFHRARK